MLSVEAAAIRLAKVSIEHVVDTQVPDDTRPETALTEFGVTSLLILSLVAAIEKELGVELSDDAFLMENFRTYGGLCALLQRQLEQSGTATPSLGGQLPDNRQNMAEIPAGSEDLIARDE